MTPAEQFRAVNAAMRPRPMPTIWDTRHPLRTTLAPAALLYAAFWVGTFAIVAFGG